MSTVKVSWSGGKDSTCAVHLHINQGDKVKVVCYIPMFTDDIPLITKEHHEFILNTAERFRNMGADVYIVTGMTYFDYVTRITTRGINKGKMFGFPSFIPKQCLFKKYSKIKALDQCDVGPYDYEDIGIAYDETERHNQLNKSKRSILVEKNYSENDCYLMCLEHNMLSPHYKFEKRDGCSLCGNATEIRRKKWFSDYPEAIPILIELQNLVKEKRPDRPPLRNYKYFIE